MSRFGERIMLFYGDVAGSDGTNSPPRETDGFLTVTLAGSDKNCSYATAVIETSVDDTKTVVGEITWTYSAQQDFKKSISVCGADQERRGDRRELERPTQRRRYQSARAMDPLSLIGAPSNDG